MLDSVDWKLILCSYWIVLQISKALTGADRKDLMRKLPKFIYDEEKALEVKIYLCFVFISSICSYFPSRTLYQVSICVSEITSPIFFVMGSNRNLKGVISVNTLHI